MSDTRFSYNPGSQVWKDFHLQLEGGTCSAHGEWYERSSYHEDDPPGTWLHSHIVWLKKDSMEMGPLYLDDKRRKR